MSLHLLLPLTILVVKLFEEVARRVGVPKILGAIGAGMLLGQIGFDVIPTSFHSQHSNTSSFNDLAQIGLCVLLFRIGTESRFDLLKKIWVQAVLVALTGMFLPLILGYGTAILLGYSNVTSFFVGATLTATSIGVTIPVLKELQGLNSKEGLIITGASILDDVFGLILLSIILTVVQPAGLLEGNKITIIIAGIVFLLTGFTLGPVVVRWVLRLLHWLNCTHLILVFAFGYLLILAQIAQGVGLDMIIGAYAAGVAFSTVGEREQVETGLKPLTDLFSPLFFVVIGASVQIPDLTLDNPQIKIELFFFFALIFVAFVGKIFSGLLLDKSFDRKIVGCGMLPRGEVGLIFAQVGFLSGVITESFFSLLVVLLLLTTYSGPLLLKYFWNKNIRRKNT